MLRVCGVCFRLFNLFSIFQTEPCPSMIYKILMWIVACYLCFLARFVILKKTKFVQNHREGEGSISKDNVGL